MKSTTNLLLVIVMNYLLAYGQDTSNAKAFRQLEQSQKEYASRSDDERKLKYGLYELLREAESADSSAEAMQKFKDHLKLDKMLKADSEDHVRILIQLKSVSNLVAVQGLIEPLDGVIEEVYKDFPYALCRIHPKRLRALASLPLVISIQPNVEGTNNNIK